MHKTNVTITAQGFLIDVQPCFRCASDSPRSKRRALTEKDFQMLDFCVSSFVSCKQFITQTCYTPLFTSILTLYEYIRKSHF